MAFVSLDSPSCGVPCLILHSVVYRDVTRQTKGLYRLKHVGALKSGLTYLSRYNSGWFYHRYGLALLQDMRGPLGGRSQGSEQLHPCAGMVPAASPPPRQPPPSSRPARRQGLHGWRLAIAVSLGLPGGGIAVWLSLWLGSWLVSFSRTPATGILLCSFAWLVISLAQKYIMQH
jgi:hypothetical protein